MQFQKQYTGERYGSPSKQNGEELFTEQSGYIPAQKRIENLLMAGQRLTQARHEAYDYSPDYKGHDYDIDITRSKGFDMADATQQALIVQDRLRIKELERIAALKQAEEKEWQDAAGLVPKEKKVKDNE